MADHSLISYYQWWLILMRLSEVNWLYRRGCKISHFTFPLLLRRTLLALVWCQWADVPGLEVSQLRAWFFAQRLLLRQKKKQQKNSRRFFLPQHGGRVLNVYSKTTSGHTNTPSQNRDTRTSTHTHAHPCTSIFARTWGDITQRLSFTHPTQTQLFPQP